MHPAGRLGGRPSSLSPSTSSTFNSPAASSNGASPSSTALEVWQRQQQELQDRHEQQQELVQQNSLHHQQQTAELSGEERNQQLLLYQLQGDVHVLHQDVPQHLSDQFVLDVSDTMRPTNVKTADGPPS